MEQIVDLFELLGLHPVFANLVFAVVAVLSYLYGLRKR